VTIELLVAAAIGWLVACAVYLLLRGRSFTVVLGLALLGYGVNLLVFAMGRVWIGGAPIVSEGHAMADPLPQALVLTAIVIGFATTAFTLVVALRSRHDNASDHVDGEEPPS
jgi:multicomponent K+:H+ antiporter subunit C